ncbi:hypothetical protein CRG98_019367 [Punica granatum]|uniref:Uncharacterized protein n=1 Tax=Punica granatum TaxID=22663 RepID=A0A2I0JV28_PUNGR|nr:hypothetical protein CRG98_019367 [Punica granatum]
MEEELSDHRIQFVHYRFSPNHLTPISIDSTTKIRERDSRVPFPQLRQTLAVGIVTQMGAYFFLASGVPRFGSSSASAAPAMAATAVVAAAKTKSRRPLTLSSALAMLLSSTPAFSPSAATLVALATIRPRRGAKTGCAEAAKNEAVMVIEAIVGELVMWLAGWLRVLMTPTLWMEGELVLWVKSAKRELKEMAMIHFLILRSDFFPNGFLPRGTFYLDRDSWSGDPLKGVAACTIPTPL